MKQGTREQGQAMAEAALFSLTAVLLGFAILALIPLHRTRTAATAAAYACTQFVSQSHDPEKAVSQAEEIAWMTLDSAWSGTPGSEYAVEAWTAGAAGAGAGCTVSYRPRVLFNGLLGLSEPGWRTVSFATRVEAWKARWP